MKIFEINKPLVICVVTSFSLTISACGNVQKVHPNIYTDKKVSESKTSYDDSNQTNSSKHSLDSITPLEWSALNNDEQVNEIKRIVRSYGGELQGLGYGDGDGDAKILETADIYVLNANTSDAKRLKLTETLSKLIGTPIVVNIQNSRLTQEMASLENLELPAINQNQIANFSIYNDEHINEVASIVERYGAKLQSVGYSDDSELSLSISYYPKKLTISDFENLERELKQLTGLNVAIDRRSITIKPL